MRNLSFSLHLREISSRAKGKLNKRLGKQYKYYIYARIYQYTYVYSIYIYILNVIEFIWNSYFEVTWFGASVKTPRQRFGKRESSEDGVYVGFDGHGQILRDATQGVKACPGPFDTFNGLVGKAGKATGNHGFDSWPSKYRGVLYIFPSTNRMIQLVEVQNLVMWWEQIPSWELCRYRNVYSSVASKCNN